MNENYIDEKNKNLELPIEKIIGDPFYAAIDTQSKMGKLSLEFINQLGFDSDSNQISYLEFSSCIPEISENNSIIEKNFSIKVPILSILSIPNLYLTNIEVDFNMQITRLKNDVVYGNLCSDDLRFKNHDKPTYKFKIKAKNDSILPPGLQKTLKIFDNVNKISSEYLKKTVFRIINVVNVIPNQHIEFQINPSLIDLEYVFENKSNFLGKKVTLTGVKDDIKNYYNGDSKIIDLKFLDFNRKIVINDHQTIKYFYITIDKRHYQARQNKQIIENLNTQINNLNYNIQKLTIKKKTPLKFCNSEIISQNDQKLSMNELDCILNSFEGSNRERSDLEKKINLAINFENEINKDLEDLNQQKVSLINEKQQLISENNINPILTQNRVNGCFLTH